MAGINTGSFFSRLGGQMPGMVNSLAQKYGAPDMAGGVKASSALLGRQKKSKLPQGPKVTSGIPAGQMPGTPVRMQAPGLMPSMPGGINTAPTNPPAILNAEMPMRADMPMGAPGFGGGFWNPSAPKLGVDGQYSTPSMPQLDGLFGAYNRIRF